MRALLLSLVLTLLLAPCAGAATLTGQRTEVLGNRSSLPALKVTVTAQPGEANDVTIRREPPGLRFRDDGARSTCAARAAGGRRARGGLRRAEPRLLRDRPGDGDEPCARERLPHDVRLGPGARTATGAALDGGEATTG
jgi:hypothetical protein